MTEPTNINEWSRDQWINQAKNARNGLVHCFVPMVSLDYKTHMPTMLGIKPQLEHGNNQVVITNTKFRLNRVGIEVLHVDETNTGIINWLTNNPKHHISVQQEFLDKKRNVFILQLTDGLEFVSFVCEYREPVDPLADYTVNYEDVARYEASRRRFSNFIERLGKKRESEKEKD